MERILFETANKIKWVQKIASIVNQCESEDNDILLDFDECIAESELNPFHLLCSILA